MHGASQHHPLIQTYLDCWVLCTELLAMQKHFSQNFCLLVTFFWLTSSGWQSQGTCLQVSRGEQGCRVTPPCLTPHHLTGSQHPLTSWPAKWYPTAEPTTTTGPIGQQDGMHQMLIPSMPHKTCTWFSCMWFCCGYPFLVVRFIHLPVFFSTAMESFNCPSTTEVTWIWVNLTGNQPMTIYDKVLNVFTILGMHCRHVGRGKSRQATYTMATTILTICTYLIS